MNKKTVEKLSEEIKQLLLKYSKKKTFDNEMTNDVIDARIDELIDLFENNE